MSAVVKAAAIFSVKNMITNQIGRLEIFTDAPIVNKQNIVEVLRQAYIEHLQNADRETYLIKYEAGIQPILDREKDIRPEINNKCVDNIANEGTEFHLGYEWGNPITFIQSGENDFGGNEEPEALTLLNKWYAAEHIKSKTQKLGRFVEITGIGYTFVYLKKRSDWEEGDSPFGVENLDPRYAFVIKSSYYPDHRDMVGVTFRTDNSGNSYFTCYTKDRVYIIENIVKIINDDGTEKDVDEWNENRNSGVENQLGLIPIIEWQRAADRMGGFERQIPEMDNLNILISDFTNDVDQNTQVLWHGVDIEFPKNEKGETVNPKTGDFLLTQTTQQGGKPSLNPLVVPYDYTGILNNIITRRQLILQKMNVPQRSDNLSGATGVAMDDATGWNAAEVSASKKEEFQSDCKMKEVKVVLAAIKKAPSEMVPSDSPIRELNYSEVAPSIKRQRNFDLATKANFFATVISHGVHPLHALKAMNLWEDANQTYEDSKELIERYQASVFDKSDPVGGEGEVAPDNDKIMTDMSDYTSQKLDV